MPEVVEADLRQARPLEERLEAVRGYVLAGERLPGLGGEDEAVLAPQGARPVYLP